MIVQRFWPSLVAGTLLAIAATTLWWAGLNEESAGVGVAATSEPRAAERPVQEYLEFVGDLRPDSSPHAVVIVDGLRKLAGALSTIENTPPEVPIDLRVVAEHIVLSPDSLGTTNAVRKSLLSAADSLDSMYPDAPPLLPLAESIEPTLPVTEQHDDLITFLVRAADSIRGASRTSVQSGS